MAKTKKEAFRIGVAGLGTVGVGVIKILQKNADLIEKRAGRPIEIISIIAGNKNKQRGVDLSAYEWANSLPDMAKDDRLDAVIEVIGGSDGDIKVFVESAVQHKKHVVTANKALMAHHGYELARQAEENEVVIAYEAAIAGGIPIIKTLREGLAGNAVTTVYGILNGTCNYILTEMRETGRDFDDVLKEAQEKGYAEADPAFDIEGIDAAHKLALLAAVAFGAKPDFDSLQITGIKDVTAQDIKFADELGYRIKLLGMAHHDHKNFIQSVEPCLVPNGSVLASVEGVFNAVYTDGDFVDKIMLEGQGAGEGPTASSVVADIIDLARGDLRPVFGVPVSVLQEVQWQNSGVIEAKYYIHLHVKDEPGVLADITAELKNQDISIDSFIQHGHADTNATSVVIVSHKTTLPRLQKALSGVEKLGSVLDKPMRVRIEDI